SVGGDEKKFLLSFLFGLDLFNPKDLVSVIGFDTFGTGYHWGFQFEYKSSDRLSFGLRTECLTKKALVTDADTDVKFDFTLGSTPISLGIAYRLGEGNGPWFVRTLFMAGVGMNTHFTSYVESES